MIITSRLSQDSSQRGAALITVLLISTLLLIAGGTLILTTSLIGTSTADSAAEVQAYYGAEAGLQATLNVLRGNVMPNPLFVANPVGGVAPENRIDFTKALTLSKSNLASDPTTSGFPKRLSRWLSYNYTPTGGSYAERVAVSANYNPISGIAYSVALSDPDNTPSPGKPLRMIVDSTGYGPRGARKVLSMMLSANGLDIDIPATVVLRGHDNGLTNPYIDLGASAAKTFSGHDNAGIEASKPTFAVNAHDLSTLQAAYASKPGSVSDPKFNVLDLPTEPYPGGVKPPWFLNTANDARAFLAQAEVLAAKRGVILSSLSGAAGTTTAPQFTLVKGDCTLDGGAGLLIVTGTLYFNGPGPNFDGVILVLGAGSVVKQGGGNRDILGSMMIARFGATGGFLEPTFDFNGGAGVSNLQYDSRAVMNSVILAGPSVLGVAER